MSNVSVVMVSYYTGPALWLAMEAALAQPECKEIVLVDNGNVPGLRQQLTSFAEKHSRFKLITGQGNIGFAKACNLGARAATGDYLLLLNPDSMLPEGGLARALKVLTSYPKNTLAGCYLINPDGTEQRGGRRALLTPRNAIGESLGLQRFFGAQGQLNFNTTPMPETTHEVPAISGAFMMLSRAFYTQLGGLDESYFLHMEDMDLCFRVHQAGGKVICMPEVKVIHFRSTSEASSAIVERHKTRGFIRYLKTHFAQQYSPAFFRAMNSGIWLRYGLKCIVSVIDRMFVPPLEAKRKVAQLVLLYRSARFTSHNISLKEKTVLIAGGSGQLGLSATSQAMARGAKVIATYHNTYIPFSDSRLKWVQRNLTDEEGINIPADMLIYTLSLWTLPDLLESIAKAGIKRIVAFSSTSLLSKVGSESPFDKALVERLAGAEKQVLKICTEKSIAVTILRPTMIYGVGLDSNITKLADIVRRFGILPIYGNASGMRQPVQATDLAEAALDIYDNPLTYGKCYNLGGSELLSYHDMLARIYAYLGKPLRLIRPPFMPKALDVLGTIYQVGYLNGDMARRMNQDLVFDIKDAMQDFGYAPKGFLQGDIVI